MTRGTFSIPSSWKSVFGLVFTDAARRQEARLALEDTQSEADDQLALIKRILEGEIDLFAVLIEPHTARLVRAVTGVVADRQSAEDVVQDALMIAYQNLSRFRGDGSFAGWLLRIAIRQGLKTRRRLKEWWGRFHSWEIDDMDLDDRPALMVEEVDRWMVWLSRVPGKERTALILHSVEGYSHAEIAEIMGATIGTVGSWIFRARQRLESLGLKSSESSKSSVSSDLHEEDHQLKVNHSAGQKDVPRPVGE